MKMLESSVQDQCQAECHSQSDKVDNQNDEAIKNVDEKLTENELFRLPDDRGNMLNVLEAAEKGRLNLLKQFYQIDPQLINIQDSDGYSPLHRACYNNRIDVVKWLIKHGANIRAKTSDGWEPLHTASQWGHCSIVRILLAMGADINSKTNGGNTPFHLAATRGLKNRLLIENLLFRTDIDLDIRNDASDTPYDILKRCSMLYKLWNLL
ncbi:Ankyrin repeat domain-containing protein 49 [Sarcoptes scabiei]|uniref:Ankyrin repeat domain-containing protein 49 n=2 Tax=Sarcoptes scabiei TaxID=52283 RepID=A0A834VDC0_SARSC|nr:Ankyrin repeat domain-containing protein 49 [Sarcoptes scabiei]